MTDHVQRLLLLIDDEPAQTRMITSTATREGWRTVTVRDGKTALGMLNSQEGAQIAAVVMDQWVAGDSVCPLISSIKAMRADVPIVLLTSSASPLLAVEAMRAGATDYLVKPITSERFTSVLRLASTRYAARELLPLAEKLDAPIDFDEMVGASPAFRTALAMAAKAARSHSPMLIEGESGSGKEMLIRAIHAASTRAKAPLKFLNLAAIPANQMESELFGHEKGAFAGAFDRYVGALQELDGGTLVIDEIDRLPPKVQERLVESLQRNDVRPIGASHSFRVDVRVISTSSTSLSELVGAELFRQDLLSAISPVHIYLPALRERSADIPALVRHFLARIGEQPGLRPLGITDGALSLLSAYDWPGNARQLQASLFRACVFCQTNVLTAEDFPHLLTTVGASTSSVPADAKSGGIMLYAPDGNLRPLEDIEADVIRLAIGHYRGRMTEVARRLGIGRSTLYRKLGDLGIDNAA